MNSRLQRRADRERKQARIHLIAATLAIVLGVFVVGAIVLTFLDQADRSVCRQASAQQYINLHCADVMGGGR